MKLRRRNCMNCGEQIAFTLYFCEDCMPACVACELPVGDYGIQVACEKWICPLCWDTYKEYCETCEEDGYCPFRRKEKKDA